MPVDLQSFEVLRKDNTKALPVRDQGLLIFDSIPLRYIKPDFVNAVTISKQTNMYAYMGDYIGKKTYERISEQIGVCKWTTY